MTVLRKVTIGAALLLGVVFAIAPATQAGVVFSDNFNAENGGSGSLNYSAFANWTVTAGTVDLIGNGFFDFYPGNGLYVDLDGSSFQAGILSTTMTFGPGTYNVSFDLGGNHRGAQADVVTMTFDGYSEVFTLNSADPLSRITRTIPIGATSPFSLTFHNAGGDNIGAILDNVEVSAVPEPSLSFLLGVTLLGGVAYLRRARLAA